MTETELPPRGTRLTFHGPLSEARAARIDARLTGIGPRTVLDIGCGWGELMLRILAAAPDATGLGLDTDEGDLARGRDSARARGLDGRVTFVRESGVGTSRVSVIPFPWRSPSYETKKNVLLRPLHSAGPPSPNRGRMTGPPNVPPKLL